MGSRMFKGSYTEIALNYLEQKRSTGSDADLAVTTEDIQTAVEAAAARFGKSPPYKAYGRVLIDRFLTAGVLAPTDSTIGRMKVYKILPPPNQIISWYLNKGKKSETPMGKKFAGSVAEVAITALIEHRKEKPTISTADLRRKILDAKQWEKQPSDSSIYSVVHRLRDRGIFEPTGIKLGQAPVYNITVEADEILEYYSDRYRHKKPVKPKEEQETVEQEAEQAVQTDEDEIDAWTFGEKMIRYTNILRTKLNERDAMLREVNEKYNKLKSRDDNHIIELRRLTDKINQLQQQVKSNVARGKYQELLNANQRLERLVDQQNKRIQDLQRKKGVTFKMKDMARFNK